MATFHFCSQVWNKKNKLPIPDERSASIEFENVLRILQELREHKLSPRLQHLKVPQVQWNTDLCQLGEVSLGCLSKKRIAGSVEAKPIQGHVKSEWSHFFRQSVLNPRAVSGFWSFAGRHWNQLVASQEIFHCSKHSFTRTKRYIVLEAIQPKSTAVRNILSKSNSQFDNLTTVHNDKTSSSDCSTKTRKRWIYRTPDGEPWLDLLIPHHVITTQHKRPTQ